MSEMDVGWRDALNNEGDFYLTCIRDILSSIYFEILQAAKFAFHDNLVVAAESRLAERESKSANATFQHGLRPQWASTDMLSASTAQ